MKLLGRYGSPYTRRVGVSMHLAGIPFDHEAIPVWDQPEAVRAYNPVVRVPTLVMDDGETLVESYAILDWPRRGSRIEAADAAERCRTAQSDEGRRRSASARSDKTVWGRPTSCAFTRRRSSIGRGSSITRAQALAGLGWPQRAGRESGSRRLPLRSDDDPGRRPPRRSPIPSAVARGRSCRSPSKCPALGKLAAAVRSDARLRGLQALTLFSRRAGRVLSPSPIRIAAKHGPLFSLIADPAFRRVWLAGALIGTVRWLEFLAIGVYVFATTGSAAQVAFMTMLRMAPMALLGAIVGAMAERISKRQLLLGMVALGMVTSGVQALLAWYGVLALWHVAIGATLSGVLWAVEMPVRRTMLGEIGGLERTAAAMALDTASNNGTRMLGPAFGGLLLELVGIHGAFALGVALYAAAIPAAVRPAARDERRAADRLSFIRPDRRRRPADPQGQGDRRYAGNHARLQHLRLADRLARPSHRRKRAASERLPDRPADEPSTD